MNQLIIPLGADVGVFIVKALIVALVASWFFKKYIHPLFKGKSEQAEVEEVQGKVDETQGKVDE
ncbi:hypothetical protein [Marininema mesophilum]|uniref:hypothetical protein n=1 Tax=Marininema mesophilum TaxID=1048340 RepID=UPI00115FB0B8|nr:hypothetical protein [Marininema mesophilum]